MPRATDEMAEAHACFKRSYGGHVDEMNPAVSEKQRKFMGAELRRQRAGKKTKTHMSEEQLREFARK